MEYLKGGMEDLGGETMDDFCRCFHYHDSLERDLYKNFHKMIPARRGVFPAQGESFHSVEKIIYLNRERRERREKIL